MRRVRRRGFALLEAIVALAIITIAGVAAAIAVRQGVETVSRVTANEVTVRRASAFMDAVALWPRADLDRHLGDRAEGPWRLHVDRPLPALYLVTLSDSARELLRTALYRPDTT